MGEGDRIGLLGKGCLERVGVTTDPLELLHHMFLGSVYLDRIDQRQASLFLSQNRFGTTDISSSEQDDTDPRQFSTTSA